MLLDPLEEEFDPPTCSIQLSHSECIEQEVVREKDKRAIMLCVEKANAPKMIRIGVVGTPDGERDSLISHYTRRFVHWIWIQSSESQIAFSADHKKGSRVVDVFQALKVHVASIQDIVGSSFVDKVVEHQDVMDARSRNSNNCGHIWREIKQRVKLDSCARLDMSFSFCPGKERQA